MMMNPAIGVKIAEEQGSQSVLPTTEKRKHAEVGDESKPTPPEKRSCVEYVDQQPPDSLPLGAANTYDESSDEEMGDIGADYFVSEEADEYRDFTGVCTNPFKSLNFEENPGLYDDLMVFADKAIPHCNTLLETDLRFKDFEEVTSCHSDCRHHSVLMNVIDPHNKISIVILRGRLRSGATFAVADLQDFLIIGAYNNKPKY